MGNLLTKEQQTITPAGVGVGIVIGGVLGVSMVYFVQYLIQRSKSRSNGQQYNELSQDDKRDVQNPNSNMNSNSFQKENSDTIIVITNNKQINQSTQHPEQKNSSNQSAGFQGKTQQQPPQSPQQVQPEIQIPVNKPDPVPIPISQPDPVPIPENKPVPVQILIIKLTDIYRPEIYNSIPNLRLIDHLYDNSNRLRQVPEEYRNFVGILQNQAELIENYSSEQQHEFNQRILQKLKGYRRIRGDGNCFYTAFIVQFLLIVIQDYTVEEFNKFIKETSKLPFLINFENGFMITAEHSEQLSYQFLKMMVELRQAEYKEVELVVQLGNTNGYLYGLSNIFIRNLVNKLVQEDAESMGMAEAIGYDISKDLLFWEKECEMNEIVLSVLAKGLKLHIVTYLIDSQSETFVQNQYGEGFPRRVALILQPGHYTQAIERLE